MKFNVGDKIRLISKNPKYGCGPVKVGDVGTILTVSGRELEICFPNHSCWSGVENEVEKVAELQSIHIYQKGQDVIATLKTGKQTVKQAKATCNLQDEFDFKVGAKLAFQRLMGEEIKLDETLKCPQVVPYDKYKAGDRVKVRNDLVVGQYYGHHCFTAAMKSTDPVTIENIGARGGYYIKEFEMYISCEMIEGKVIENSIKEVHRPAEVREWIKIVKAYHLIAYSENPEYKNGDIFQVKSIDGGKYFVDSISEYIQQSEYVVLENYQPSPEVKPSEPKPFVKAKVGDKIKVVKDVGGHGPSICIGDVHIVKHVKRNNIDTNKGNVFYDTDEEYIVVYNPIKTLSDYSTEELHTKINELLTEIERRCK